MKQWGSQLDSKTPFKTNFIHFLYITQVLSIIITQID